MPQWMMNILSMIMTVISPPVHAGDAIQLGSAYDFAFQSIDGKPMPLNGFKGRVIMVVNTASFCGFTPQYKGLEALYEKYDGQGLTIVGVPSNDFGGQEPKREGEIKAFCEGAYGLTFPLTQKYAVHGASAHPFYKWATGILGPKAEPRWNFHKIVVGRDGRVVAAFNSGFEPANAELVGLIETELHKSTMPASQ